LAGDLALALGAALLSLQVAALRSRADIIWLLAAAKAAAACHVIHVSGCSGKFQDVLIVSTCHCVVSDGSASQVLLHIVIAVLSILSRSVQDVPHLIVHAAGHVSVSLA
jgi:hypothetical protein